MNESRNLFIALALSMAVVFTWQILFAPPPSKAPPDNQQTSGQQGTIQQQTVPGNSPGTINTANDNIPGLNNDSIPGSNNANDVKQAGQLSRKQALASSPRVAIKTGLISGSINLRGARIDDITLTDYRETTSPDSANIVLLSPKGTKHPYYAEFGFITSGGNKINLPNSNTLWQVKTRGDMSEGNPLVLSYSDNSGHTFTRSITIGDDYLFTFVDEITNNSANPLPLHQYGLISRQEQPKTLGFFILHEGAIMSLGEAGVEHFKYSDVVDDKQYSFNDIKGGWFGLTDKYWAAALIPDSNAMVSNKVFYTNNNNTPNYQVQFVGNKNEVAPGQSITITSRLFAGAKQVATIDKISSDYNILNFDRLIDWGWLYFITKPMFYLIDFFYNFFKNFGLAILAATVVVKLILFPLANKSYVSMSKMKKVQPKILTLREQYKDDRQQQQKAMMELYRQEKINPLAGCVPILIQIPIFFAIYKVLFITIEMRHAPFFGWIKDLADRDPTSIFNLFGLLPWDPPTLLIIGIWPIIMGITMFLQMSLNPAPPDPTQQFIFKWMPLFFTFLLASFPAGLVIYWAWNNTLSIIQQYIIMRRQGVDVDFIGNIMAKFRRSKE